MIRPPASAHDVFISYSKHDKPIADAVCATLEGRRIRCWIAPRDAQAGIPYPEQLTDAIEQSRLLVLVLSSNSNQSDQVMREVEAAVNEGLPIVPIRIEEIELSKSLRYLIKSIHWLDAITPPVERHLNHVAETVGLLLSRSASDEVCAAGIAEIAGANGRKRTEAPHPEKGGLIGVLARKLGSGIVALVAAAVLLIGLLGMWASGVLKVKTPDGTIVLENLPPDAQVIVDGNKVAMNLRNDGRIAEIPVRPGTRIIGVIHNGVKIISEEVVIEEGGRKVVTASIEPASKTGIGFAGTRPGQERDDNTLRMKFCWCPRTDRFIMGSPANEPLRDEPGHAQDEDQVEVKIHRGFWMAKYPVTQGEWERVMGTSPSYFRAGAGGQGKVQGIDTSRFPVEQVDYPEATKFALCFTREEQNAGRLPAGWEYRLPTEAQWEYACRAGTKTATAFGDKLDSTQANFNGDCPYNTTTRGPFLRRTTAVGSYPANNWGLQDMHGNVFQWCRDWYAEKLPGGEDPEVTVPSSARVLRGGCWHAWGRYCRSAYRRSSSGMARFLNYVGFRLVAVQSSTPTGIPE
jgi:formylglycine-generating enzyme